MNKVYKTVWNKARGQMVVASEVAGGDSKGVSRGESQTAKAEVAGNATGTVPVFSCRVSRSVLPLALMAGFGLLGIPAAWAGTGTGGGTGSGTAISLVNGGTGTPTSGGNVQATAIYSGDVAIGDGSYATGTANSDPATAVGYMAKANGAGSVAIGDRTQAGAAGTSQSVAIGAQTTALGDQATALGNNAVARGDSGVAIGGDDLDKVANRTYTATINGTTETKTGAQLFTDLTGSTAVASGTYYSPTAGDGSVALGPQARAGGSTASNGTYTTQGVFDVAIGAQAYATGFSSIALGTAAQATADTSFAIGPNSRASAPATIAFGVSSVASQPNAVAIGTGGTSAATYTQAAGKGATAIGGNAVAGAIAAADNSVAIGGQSKANNANDVALGAGSISGAPNTGATAKQVTLAGTTYTFSGPASAAAGVVSVGGTAANTQRQIQNVAAGDVSSGSTDAINGSQLYATNQALAAQQTRYYSVSSSTTGAGSNYANDGATGLNALAVGVSAKAPGQNDTAVGSGAKTSGSGDATAIGSQAQAIGQATAIGLNSAATGGSSTAIGNAAKATQSSAAAVGSNANALGVGTVAFGSQAQALRDQSVAIGLSAKAGNTAVGSTQGVSAVAIGYQSQAIQNNTVALGAAATANNANDVALGSGSTTAAPSSGPYTINGGTIQATSDTNGVVSIGAGGKERQIQNLAAGTISATSTDAVNGSQLFAVGTTLNNVGTGAANALGGGASFNTTTGAFTGPSYTIGGTSYTNVGSALTALQSAQALAAAHYYSVNDGGVATKPGNFNNDGAQGKNSLAAGVNASTAAGALDGIALGYGANVAGTAGDAVAIGTNASVTSVGAVNDTGGAAGVRGIAIGLNASTTMASSIAVGYGALVQNTTGSTSSPASAIAIGTDAAAMGDSSIAIGRNAGSTKSTGSNNVVVGIASGQNIQPVLAANNGGVGISGSSNVAFGVSSGNNVTGSSNAAFGTNAGNNVGPNTDATGSTCVFLPGGCYGGNLNGTNNLAIGGAAGNNVQGGINTGIGWKAGSSVNGFNNVGIGQLSGYSVTGSANVGIGDFGGAYVTGLENTGVGNGSGANVTGNSNSALGNGSGVAVWGNNNLALGMGAAKGTAPFKQGNGNAYAGSGVKGDNNVAMGNGAGQYVTGSGNFAAGLNAGSGVAPVIDSSNNVTTDAKPLVVNNTIALGTGAMAAVDNSVVVGSQSSVVAGATSGIALGRGATVNGAYGIAQGDGVTTGSTGYNVAIGSDGTTANSNSGAGGAVAIGRNVKATGDGAVALGDPGGANGNGAIAQGLNANAYGDGSVALGNSVNAGPSTASAGTTTGAVAIGTNTNAQYTGAVALGNGATANNANDVALGSGSSTAAPNVTPSVTINGTTYKFAGGGPAGASSTDQVNSVVSVGSAGNERQITNVAAGQISGGSTDAINGSQLYATNQAIGTVANNPLTFAGDSGANVQRKLGQTLNVTGGATGALSTGNIGVTGNGTDTLSVQLAKTITGLDSVTAGGTKISSSGVTFVDTSGNSVANSPSVTSTGINAGGNTITNVASGVNATDAANVGQVQAGAFNAQLAAPVVYTDAAGDKLAKAIDGKWYLASAVNPDGTLIGTPTPVADANVVASVQSAGGSTTTATKLTNVANGALTSASTDAVNGSQLYSTNQVISTQGSDLATVLGGNAAYNSVTGALTMSNVGGTGKNNVNDAIAAVNTAAAQPLTFAGDSGANVQRTLGQTLNVTGGATGTLTSGNIGVTGNGKDTLQVQLAQNLDLGSSGSVKTGNSTLNNAGLTVNDGTSSTTYGSTGMAIAGGPSVTTTGVDAGGKTITNVASGGTTTTNAANIGDVQAAVAGATYGAQQAAPVVYTDSTGTKLAKANDGKWYPASAVSPNGSVIGTPTPVPTANVIASMQNAGGSTTAPATLTNVAAGALNSTSTDAVNGSQLNTTNQNVATNTTNLQNLGNSVATGLGGTSSYDATTGTLTTGLSVGGVSYTNVNAALNGINAGATAGWDVSTSVAAGTSGQAIVNPGNANVGPGGTHTIQAGNNIITTQTGTSVEIGVNPNLTGLNSVSIVGGPTLNNGGIDMNGTRISNLAPGTAPSDAATMGQVNAAADKWSAGNPTTYAAPQATGANSFAGGSGAVASGQNSVALGNGSVADRSNSVSVGAPGQERQVTNVAPGSAGTDAVNVNQMAGAAQQAQANAQNYTDQRINGVYGAISDVGKRADAGVAGAMATASLPQPYRPGQSMVGAALGGYHGQAGIAVGVSTITDSGSWVFKANVSGNTQGNVGVGVGAGFVW